MIKFKRKSWKNLKRLILILKNNYFKKQEKFSNYLNSKNNMKIYQCKRKVVIQDDLPKCIKICNQNKNMLNNKYQI